MRSEPEIVPEPNSHDKHVSHRMTDSVSMSGDGKNVSEQNHLHSSLKYRRIRWHKVKRKGLTTYQCNVYLYFEHTFWYPRKVAGHVARWSAVVQQCSSAGNRRTDQPTQEWGAARSNKLIHRHVIDGWALRVFVPNGKYSVRRRLWKSFKTRKFYTRQHFQIINIWKKQEKG